MCLDEVSLGFYGGLMFATIVGNTIRHSVGIPHPFRKRPSVRGVSPCGHFLLFDPVPVLMFTQRHRTIVRRTRHKLDRMHISGMGNECDGRVRPSVSPAERYPRNECSVSAVFYSIFCIVNYLFNINYPKLKIVRS